MSIILSFVIQETLDIVTPVVFKCSFTQEGPPVLTKLSQVQGEVNKTEITYIDKEGGWFPILVKTNALHYEVLSYLDLGLGYSMMPFLLEKDR